MMSSPNAVLIDQYVNEYNAVIPKYKKFCSVLENILKRLASHISSEILIQVRVKTLPSFAEKIIRKWPKYNNPLHQLTDLAGARIMTTDPKELRQVCDAIEEYFEVDLENSWDVSRRYTASEFGYRSVHYIVSLSQKTLNYFNIQDSASDYFVEPRRPMVAEIQVRTLLEHAWSVFEHDRVYKGSLDKSSDRFSVWKRELAAQAAALESVDKTFERIGKELNFYQTHNDAYLSPEKINEEIDIATLVQKHDPDNINLALHIAKLATNLGKWDIAIHTLSPQLRLPDLDLMQKMDPRQVSMLVVLGQALCRRNLGSDHLYGRRYLDKALEEKPKDIQVLMAWTEAYREEDPKRAKECLAKAFEVDPTHPDILVGHLLETLVQEKSIRLITTIMVPFLNKATEHCQEFIQLKIHIPEAYFTLGQLALFLGKPYKSLSAFAQGIRLSQNDEFMTQALRNLDRLREVGSDLEGWSWMRLFLLVGRHARFPSWNSMNALQEERNLDVQPFASKQVLILAGGCSSEVEDHMQSLRPILFQALRDFHGIILSGGTRQGIAGLAGDLGEKYPENIHVIGYLPKAAKKTPSVTIDFNPIRYRELYESKGINYFTPLEPLQAWVDLLAQGVTPNQVRLIGINGGDIALAEYWIALALGCSVGVLEGQKRASSRLLSDQEWKNAQGLSILPNDPETLRQFVSLPK
ncbi:MAG: RelA/SpoT domain-containing protein [Magnetococcus sp. DMHC-6]